MNPYATVSNWTEDAELEYLKTLFSQSAPRAPSPVPVDFHEPSPAQSVPVDSRSSTLDLIPSPHTAACVFSSPILETEDTVPPSVIVPADVGEIAVYLKALPIDGRLWAAVIEFSPVVPAEFRAARESRRSTLSALRRLKVEPLVLVILWYCWLHHAHWIEGFPGNFAQRLASTMSAHDESGFISPELDKIPSIPTRTLERILDVATSVWLYATSDLSDLYPHSYRVSTTTFDSSGREISSEKIELSPSIYPLLLYRVGYGLDLSQLQNLRRVFRKENGVLWKKSSNLDALYKTYLDGIIDHIQCSKGKPALGYLSYYGITGSSVLQRQKERHWKLNRTTFGPDCEPTRIDVWMYLLTQAMVSCTRIETSHLAVSPLSDTDNGMGLAVNTTKFQEYIATIISPLGGLLNSIYGGWRMHNPSIEAADEQDGREEGWAQLDDNLLERLRADGDLKKKMGAEEFVDNYVFRKYRPGSQHYCHAGRAFGYPTKWTQGIDLLTFKPKLVIQVASKAYDVSTGRPTAHIKAGMTLTIHDLSHRPLRHLYLRLRSNSDAELRERHQRLAVELYQYDTATDAWMEPRVGGTYVGPTTALELKPLAREYLQRGLWTQEQYDFVYTDEGVVSYAY